MKNKKVYLMLFVLVLGFISLYFFSLSDIQLQKSAQRAKIQSYNFYRVLGFLSLIFLGILIEYKTMISIFKNGIKLKTLPLIATALLFVLLILPYNITGHLGVTSLNSIKGTLSFIINTTSTRGILSLLTGIFFVRSLSSEGTEK